MQEELKAMITETLGNDPLAFADNLVLACGHHKPEDPDQPSGYYVIVYDKSFQPEEDFYNPIRYFSFCHTQQEQDIAIAQARIFMIKFVDRKLIARMHYLEQVAEYSAQRIAEENENLQKLQQEQMPPEPASP